MKPHTIIEWHGKGERFNPDFINAQIDAAIAYMDSCGCDEYTAKNHRGFRVSFRRVQQ